jgi:hypothetical protein
MIEANANLNIVAKWHNEDSAAFVENLSVYRGQERSLLYVIHEAAEEKAHGTRVQDLSPSKGKKLKCCRILH